MNLVWNILYYSFAAVYAYIIIILILSVLSQNRKPVNSMAWIMVMITIPVAGIIIYLLAGRDLRRNNKIVENRLGFPQIAPPGDVDIESLRATSIPLRFHKVVRLLYNNNNSQLYRGTNIEIYATGEESFEALFNAIKEAKQSVHIEFFIIENDEVGNRLRDILIEKAQQGVRVRVIYDYLGAWRLPPLWLNALRSAGVYIQPFLTIKSLIGLLHVNYRNHRKIVIIDGKVAFTGGINVADRYLTGDKLGIWRDTFMRFEGESVQVMQQTFAIDWKFVDGKMITDKKYYPRPEANEGKYMQVVTSGPDSEWQNICQGIGQAISSAQSEILIQTPYCIPPESIMDALQWAALSGVDVHVMVPERIESPLAAAAGRTYIEEMLRAGIHVHYFQHNYLHSKAIVVDRSVAIVGTANMDCRSYSTDFEISTFIYDKEAAEQLASFFEHDALSSRELNYNVFHSRPRQQKFFDSIARLFSPLL